MMGGPSTTLCLGFVLSLMVMAQCQSTTTIKPETKSSEAPGSPSGGPTQPSNETTKAPPPSAPPSTDLTTQLPSTELTTQLPSTATQPPSVGTTPNLTGGVASTANLATTTTVAPENPCNDVVCGLNEVCNPTDDVIGHECQCQDGYVRNKTGTCQDLSQATCDTVDCGVPEQCILNADGTFYCNCSEFQILKEGICIDTPTTTAPATPSKASTAQPPRDPTTGPPVVPPSSTAQPSKDPSTGPPVVPTAPAVETSEPVAVTTKPAPGKGSTTVQPGQGTQPVHTSYKGPLIGLFIFLLVTTAVFIAIYMVRKRKLRNNYGRLDEDSSEGGWSAFSKNPIYRGDRDYQPL